MYYLTVGQDSRLSGQGSFLSDKKMYKKHTLFQWLRGWCHIFQRWNAWMPLKQNPFAWFRCSGQWLMRQPKAQLNPGLSEVRPLFALIYRGTYRSVPRKLAASTAWQKLWRISNRGYALGKLRGHTLNKQGQRAVDHFLCPLLRGRQYFGELNALHLHFPLSLWPPDAVNLMTTQACQPPRQHFDAVSLWGKKKKYTPQEKRLLGLCPLCFCEQSVHRGLISGRGVRKEEGGYAWTSTDARTFWNTIVPLNASPQGFY